MRVLISQSRFLLGGSETYAVTVAEQLEQLGHPTGIFAGSASPEGRELVASRGLSLTTGDHVGLADRDDVDAVIAHDPASAYALASRRELRQAFVIHGLACFEHPPQGLRPMPPVVVLNDRIRKHAEAMAAKPEVVRLRQPIDLMRFKPRGSGRREARRVLVFSNYLDATRMAMLEEACEDLGLELTSMGASATISVTPQDAIAAADIVVGYGRSVLEGMAMGRAAYVWDRAGGDGWVTPETYPVLEADGFSGGGTDAAIDVDQLRADLAAYDPEYGTLGYDLIRNHHSAAKHAEALVSLLEGMDAMPAADPVNESLGLLTRAQARAADDAARFENQLRARGEEAEMLRTRVAELQPALAVATASLEGEHTRRAALEEQLREALGSTSWRLTAPLRTLMRWLRALGRRAGGR
jgi:hypothetical protein